MAHPAGQHLGADAAQVADVEADQQVGQRPVLGRLDGALQVGDRDVAEALQRPHLVPVDRVNVADVVDQAVLDEQPARLLAQPLDVHRATGGEVVDAALALGRAVDIGAERVALPR